MSPDRDLTPDLDLNPDPAADLGLSAGEPESVRGPQARLALAQRITENLIEALDLVGIDEFYSQEAQFDQDSRLGRELLYLIANDEWSRATRETVNLQAADSVATTIQVHVDLGRITHEAFRNRLDRVWLPLVVLPPPSPRDDGQPPSGPRVAPTPLVRDHTQTIVPPLPQSEARRWIAAAMAEIILNITPAAMGEVASSRQLGREQRLLLSAAIYRVLRQGSDNPVREASGQWAAGTHIDDGYRRGRIQEARRMLTRLMTSVSHRLAVSDRHDRSTLLIRRAARVLHAVSSPSTLVVISVEPEAESRLFIVDVPARPLFGRRRPLSAPRAEIQLNVLLPAVDADRAIVVNLPEGLSFVRPNAKGQGQPVRARFRVDRPRIEWQIDNLLDQLDPDGDLPPDPVARCTVDFALSRMDVARDSYRVYRATPEDAEQRGTLPDRLPQSVARLQRSLQRIRSDGADEQAARAAQNAVRSHRRQPPAQLYRAHEGDAVSPRRAHIRVPAVENRNVRGTPVDATVRLEIVADDSTPLRAARHSGWMSILLLFAVLVFSVFSHTRSFSEGDRQVLASVLTLFAVLQAGRIQMPDRSTLRGVLDTGGSWAIVASVLPPVLLGVALAFSNFRWQAFVVAFAVQVLLQIAMYLPPVTGRAWNRTRRPRLRLRTERAGPDYARIDVLHSSWWRSTTAAALLLGASAHGYVLHQKEGREVAEFLGGDEAEMVPMPRNPNLVQRVRRRFGSSPFSDAEPESDSPFETALETATTPANILAMLRAGAAAQSLTFLVFREEPQEEWQTQTGARTVDLDVDRLIAHEAPIGHLDVFIGLPPDRLHPLATHPIRELLDLAGGRGLLVLDVQFPSPPPIGASAARSWTRTRFGVRGDEIPDLAAMLTEVLDRVRAAGERLGLEIDLLVDTSTQTPPRRFLGAPDEPPADPDLAPMPPSALDWMGLAARSAGGSGRDWVITGICQYAASGTEAQLVDAIIARHPAVELAGLTVAILHGTCIVFALGHVPGRMALPEATLPRDAQLLYEERTGRAELGQLEDGGLLLQVHAQYGDRPGLFAALLAELNRRFAAAAQGAFEPGDVRLSYIHTEVADGRNATTWFMVVLPPAAAYRHYGRVTLDKIERAGRRVLSQVGPDDPAGDSLGLLHGSKAMVSIEVITIQPEEDAPEDLSELEEGLIDLDAVSGAGPDAPANTPPFQE